LSRTSIASIALALLLTAACGAEPGDGSSSPSTSAGEVAQAAFPVEVGADNGTVTLDERPERIVSLSPTATEILFAVGAGSQVVAVDDQSNFPAEAPMTELSGFTPNVEAIVGFSPDLVVLSDDGGVVAGLEALDVPAVVFGSAETLDDTYRQIEVLGAATGNVGDAAGVVASMQAEIDDLVASVPERPAPLSYYHELDDTFYSATSSTFIGQIYSLAGLENIADAAEGDGGPFPQLSAEYIISADPDLVFLADTKCCGQSAETVAARPGWDQMTAIRTGAVHELDDDIASRWGPRVVEFLEVVIDATATVAAS
jgi:iron complex transport system substrate-binding protein